MDTIILTTTITTIKTILESIKTFRDLTSEKKEVNIDLSTIEKKLIEVENELKLIKREATIIQESGLNEIQVKLKTLFNSHGIDDVLIVKFISENIDKNFNIPLSKINDLNYVFDKFTETHIGDIFALFGVNKGWLYNKEKLYPHRCYYKGIRRFIDFVLEENRKGFKLKGYAINNINFDKENKDLNQPLLLVFRTPIAKLFNQSIYRYYPISTDWHWDYWRTRYQAKSIFFLSEKYNRYFYLNGMTINDKESFDLLEIISKYLLDSRTSC